jgi:hypothetical protein
MRKKLLLVFCILLLVALPLVSKDAMKRQPKKIVLLPSKHQAIMPSRSVAYRIAPNWLYKPSYIKTAMLCEPASIRASAAWALANEMVYRTKLSDLYVLPGCGTVPETRNLIYQSFKSIDGSSRLWLGVNVSEELVWVASIERIHGKKG